MTHPLHVPQKGWKMTNEGRFLFLEFKPKTIKSHLINQTNYFVPKYILYNNFLKLFLSWYKTAHNLSIIQVTVFC